MPSKFNHLAGEGEESSPTEESVPSTPRAEPVQAGTPSGMPLVVPEWWPEWIRMVDDPDNLGDENYLRLHLDFRIGSEEGLLLWHALRRCRGLEEIYRVYHGRAPNRRVLTHSVDILKAHAVSRQDLVLGMLPVLRQMRRQLEAPAVHAPASDRKPKPGFWRRCWHAIKYPFVGTHWDF